LSRTALLAAFLASRLAESEDAGVGCGRLADVPPPVIAFEKGASKTPLRRAYSLLRLFSEGEGDFEAGAGEVMKGLPLPWLTAPGRERNLRLVTWQNADSGNDESMPAIVLEAGASWCTPLLDLPPGARLRFEAVSGGGGKLTVDEAEWSVGAPASLNAKRQTDLALSPGKRSLCFRASRSSVAIGEARVLVPEDATSDARPRWIVLTIVDALRADALEDLPALRGLGDTGRRYTRAVSPGCHTRASVWPILTGRDLMRVDPLQRRQAMPIQAPLETSYSRGNLFVSHLAEAAGYHSVFLGNNAYLRSVPAFSRYSSWGRTDTGTLDTIERLPALFSRYAEERVLLVYYVSTPHAHSETPRRLYEELRCSELRALEECRCRYLARARHADEAIAALESGLRAHGLEGRILQAVTADHGEVFGDGRRLEGEILNFSTGKRGGAFASFDRGHGYACHPKETEVPLVLHGPGIPPGASDEVVSGLDIVPTLLQRMELRPPGNLDGASLLSGSKPAARTLVAHGFCSDSRIEGDRQLVWWLEGCRVREPDGSLLAYRAEIRSEEKQIATDASDRSAVTPALGRHEDWLLERLPFDAFVFGVDGLPEATVEVVVESGRIVDFGPAGSIYGIEGIEILSKTAGALRVRFRGFRGLYRIATLPPRAPVRIRIEDHPDAVTFAGPLQLPLPIAGRAVDPENDLPFLLASAPPPARPSALPSLRFWWQSYERAGSEAARREIGDFDRVLREWGYIR
jgi:arylsulfatase A-like enzyme